MASAWSWEAQNTILFSFWFISDNNTLTLLSSDDLSGEAGGISVDGEDNEKFDNLGMTGAVIGFVKSGTSLGLLVGLLIIVFGIGVIIKKRKKAL